MRPWVAIPECERHKGFGERSARNRQRTFGKLKRRGKRKHPLTPVTKCQLFFDKLSIRVVITAALTGTASSKVPPAIGSALPLSEKRNSFADSLHFPAFVFQRNLFWWVDSRDAGTSIAFCRDSAVAQSIQRTARRFRATGRRATNQAECDSKERSSSSNNTNLFPAVA